MDCSKLQTNDYMNPNSFHFVSSSHSGSNPPPFKRMRHSLSSSLDINDNSSMECDNNIVRTLEYRTDQSVEYQTEASIPSQDVMTCSSTCTSSIYTRSNLGENVNPTATQSKVQAIDDCDGTSIRHKRRLMNAGSNTFNSYSTNVSQSSTLTELSLMDDDIIVSIDNNVGQDLLPPEFLSDTLNSDAVVNERTNVEYDSSNEMDDTMIIDSLVSDWDQNFVLHAPTIYHTNRRTREQVQLAKRSIHRIHFKT